MASFEPITTRELLELAALDALGLLDDFESRIYTRSYHDAPASVQDQIKRLQAELASDDSILPVDEPSPALRQRVLKAVADAIERDESRLAPLATIGRRRVAGTADNRFLLSASGQFWRAACFVMAGVTVVFALFYVRAQDFANRVSEIALIRNTDAVLEELIGPTFKDFLFDDDTSFIVLDPAVPGTKGRGVVCINERTFQAFLITEDLAQGGPGSYTLALRGQGTGPDGRSDVRSFGSTGGLQGIALGTVHVSLPTARWIVMNAAGAVILTST